MKGIEGHQNGAVAVELRLDQGNRETLEEVISRNFTIDPACIPAIQDREHMARPYPGRDFDFLAVNVPSTYQQGLIPDGEEAPHGLLRIIAAATDLHKSHPLYPKHSAGLLDAHRLRMQPNEIIEQITRTTPSGVVGLNPTSVNVSEAQVIAELCDQRGIPYVLGGIHATLDPAIARHDFPNAAAIVRGTGELVIGRLIQSIKSELTPDIPGVYWPHTDHGHQMRTPDIDPNDIPVIRQDILVEEPVYEHTVILDGQRQSIKESNLFVTYGCPFECTFCSSPVLVGRNERTGVPAYRRPEMARIVDDVEHVTRDLGANAIHFLDDMAFITAGHIKEFDEEITRRGLRGDFIWRGLTRAPVIARFGEDDMRRMKDTGAWKIALGVESGSDAVLKGIKKKVKTEEVVSAVTRLAAHGIQTKGFFIFGFPGETEGQMMETRRLIQHLSGLGMTEISAFQFKPYPGTEAYRSIVERDPGVIAHLAYLRRSNSNGSKAKQRAADTPWLPDDLQIAAVPSGVVRAHVEGALEDFYTSVGSK